MGGTREDTDPGLLNQIFDSVAATRQEEQVSYKPVLVTFHHFADKRRVFFTQATRDPLNIAFALFRKRHRVYRHTPV